MGRLLLLLHQAGLDQGEQLPQGAGERTFRDLLSHADRLEGDEEAREAWGQLKEVLPEEVVGDWAYFLGVYGRFLINSFTVHSSEAAVCRAMATEMAVVGQALYLAPCILDHSCAPSAKATFQGLRLEVATTEAAASWRELTISYIDTGLPRRERRAALQELYHFSCLCPPCLGEEVLGPCPPPLASLALQEHCVAAALQETDLGEDTALLGSMLCQGCGAAVVPKEGAECASCGASVTFSQEDEYKASARAVTVLLRSKMMPSGAAPQYMDLLTELFHPCNLTYVRCCQAALCSCVLRGEVMAMAALVWGDLFCTVLYYMVCN